MESKSRSRNVPSFSPNSYLIKRQKVGLLVLEDSNPSNETHVLLRAQNITKSIVEPNAALPKSIVDPRAKSIAGESSQTPINPLPSVPKPCLIFSDYINSLRAGSGPQGPNPIDLATGNHSLPLTVCVKHGTAGFLPLEYARELPEYTCTTHRFPVPKVIHGFYDCVLEFPDQNPTAVSGSTSRRRPQDIIHVKKCCHCKRRLSHKKDIFMCMDNMYCSEECRDNGCVLPSSSSSSEGSIMSSGGGVSSAMQDGDTIFAIDLI